MKIDQIRITPEEERNDYGRFVIEPLEQGYGHTIGNSLRRVLLTSLAGAAITEVKIEGVSHQFTTLKGMTEDVTEFILNLKQVAVRLDDKEKTTAKLSVKGSKIVTARDISLPAEVTIANPNQHLATLAKGGSLDVQMVIEKGIGYGSADERPSEEIGVIPVDALYSPVVAVNYTVDATRVGRITNYDKLTLEITTNGTTTPAEALREAGKILVDHFQLFAIPGEKASVPTTVDPRQETMKKQLIDELGLSVRVVNSLKTAGIETIGGLVEKRKRDLSDIRNLGDKSIAEIEHVLSTHGLAFREEE